MFYDFVRSSGDTISYTPLGRAYNRFNPALGQTMNAALVSVIYGQSIQPPAIAPKPFEVRLLFPPLPVQIVWEHLPDFLTSCLWMT